eukprot:7377231-Prymnesium_polylepis.1
MSTDWSTSSLIVSSFLICATRCAKRHVEMDSSVCVAAGWIVATMTVLQFPPSESRSTDVSILPAVTSHPRSARSGDGRRRGRGGAACRKRAARL